MKELYKETEKDEVSSLDDRNLIMIQLPQQVRNVYYIV